MDDGEDAREACSKMGKRRMMMLVDVEIRI